MATDVFQAQLKAVDAASGPMRAMVRGMRDIIEAARGVGKSSYAAAQAAAKAGEQAGHAVRRGAEAVKHAGKVAEGAIHGVTEEERKSETGHIRFFRALSGHVRLLHGHFGELKGSIGEVGSSIREFLPALGALAVGGSLLGMFELTKEAGEAAIAFDATATKIGITANELAGLQWVAKESGIPVEAMSKGMENLNRTIGLTIAGKSKDAAAIFTHLGIKLKDTAGHTRSTTKIMEELADAFKKTEDPAQRAAVAQILMTKAGKEMLPVLMLGKDKIEDLAEAGTKFAGLGTDEQRAKLKEFGHSWGEMEAAAGGFKTILATGLADELKPIVDMTRDWIMENRKWIADDIKEAVKGLGDALKDLPLKDIIKGMEGWVKSIHAATEGHGKLIAEVFALTLAMGSPLVTIVKNVAGAFVLLAKVLRVVALVIWANPILLIAAAIALAALAIYENWGGLGDFFKEQWGEIADVFKAGLDKIKPVVDALKAAGEWLRGHGGGRPEDAGITAYDDIELSESSRRLRRAVGPTVEAARRSAPRLQSPTAPLQLFDDAPGGQIWRQGGLYRQGGPALENLQNRNELHVRMDFANVPPGAKVESTVRGIVQPPETNVGFADPMGYAS
jgi:hypothetical protein